MTTEPTTGSLLRELRTHETHATWLDHLEAIGDPAFPVELPDVEETARVLREMDVPEDDIPAVLSSRPDRDRDPGQWWLLERCVAQLVTTMGNPNPPPWFPSPYTVAGMNPFFFVHVFLATLPHTRRYHSQHGIPDDIVRATLADLGRNVRVNRKRYGEGGLEVSHWLMLHFRGCIYQLGRLQFERVRLPDRIAQQASARGELASAEQLALSIHIPDFLGPMTPDACDASFAMAREFFPQHFADEHFDWAICSSWLLDPHLVDLLPATSNIVQFQNRFTVGETDSNADSLVLQFVFGPTPDSLDALPQRSSLERAVVTHLKNGGHWRFYPGWFRWE